MVGLYLNPPDKAVVLCVDEKTQIQAPERTQPMLLLWGSATSRASPTSTSVMARPLFAALNVLDGAIIAQCKPPVLGKVGWAPLPSIR
ncbi:hypothetical protein ACVW1B_005344 [Bradyrhizobium sp. USDA 4502]